MAFSSLHVGQHPAPDQDMVLFAFLLTGSGRFDTRVFLLVSGTMLNLGEGVEMEISLPM